MTASTQTQTQPRLLGGAPAMFLAFILIVAMAAAVGLGLGRLAPAATSPASDGSYSTVEQNRAQFGVGGDSSYDIVEKNRATGPGKASSGEHERLPGLRPS